MTSLRIPAATLRTLHEQLLQDDGLERVAIAECTASGDDLLVADITVIPDDEMAILEEVRCRPEPAVERRLLAGCLAADRHPLILHSHPFADTAWLSGADYRLTAKQTTFITGLVDAIIPLFGVLTETQLHVELLHADDTFEPVPVEIVGGWTLDPEITPTTPGETTVVDRQRYDRGIRALTEDGQRALAATHVAIVGCGGIGALLADHVAGLGVQQVTFIDPDRLEASNVPRIPQATPGDVGAYKAALLQERYVQRVPSADTTVVTRPVQEAADHLVAVDVLLAGLDRMAPRVWLNQYAVQHLTYYIDAGSRIDVDEDTDAVTDMAAYVQTIAPGAGTACFDCLDRADPETLRREHLSDTELEEEVDQGYIAGTALSPEPAVIHLNGIAASLAVETLAKVVTGYSSLPDFLHYDGLANDLTRMQTHRNPACYTCSRFLAQGDQPQPDGALPLPDPAEPDPVSEDTWFPAAVTAFFRRVGS